MLALARGLVASEADAEDLVQDVLARALLRWDRVSAADEPDAYANRMLVNAAMSLFRSARWRRERTLSQEQHQAGASRPLGVIAPDDGDPGGTVVERQAVLAALRALPVRHRAVLLLRYYEDWPDADIAEALGVAPATVRSSAARGLAALRRSGALGEGDETTSPKAGSGQHPAPRPTGGPREGRAARTGDA